MRAQPTAAPPDGHHDQATGGVGPFLVTVRPSALNLLVVGFAIVCTIGGLSILADTVTSPYPGVLERLWGLGGGCCSWACSATAGCCGSGNCSAADRC